MFRGDKEPVQLDKIFKLTGYPQGDALDVYTAIEEFKTFNCDKTYTNQFAAKYLNESKSTGSSGNSDNGSHRNSLHHIHESINHPIQSNAQQQIDNYKVFDVEGLDLLQKLLDINPITRITAGVAMAHSYFTKDGIDDYKPTR